jgi:hypothetical protein
MKIENAIAHVTRTIKDYKSHPFVTCTPLFELMCEQLVSLLDSKQKQGYNYIFFVHDGRKDKFGFYLNNYILTFSDVRHVYDIKSQNYFQIDDEFSDVIDFLDFDFWYSYCLNDDRILTVVK